MNAQVAFVTFLAVTEPQRSQLPPPLPAPLLPEETGEGAGTLLVADRFDVHTWFEAYLAETHEEAFELPGVPFH